MGAVLSKRGSSSLGASRLYIEQRGNQLDVIFDAMLQLPPEEFVAPRQHRVPLGALEQPVDQQTIEARHHRIGQERRQSRVHTGYGRIGLWEQDGPGSGTAKDNRQHARAEPARNVAMATAGKIVMKGTPISASPSSKRTPIAMPAIAQLSAQADGSMLRTRRFQWISSHPALDSAKTNFLPARCS